MPVDRDFLVGTEFQGLLDRLKLVSSEEQDNWILWSHCGKCRVVSYKECQEVEKSGDWTCKELKGKRRGCHVEQTRAEVYGQKYMMYATRKEENDLLAAYLQEDRFFGIDVSDNEGSQDGSDEENNAEREGQVATGCGPAQEASGDEGDEDVEENEDAPVGRPPENHDPFPRGHMARSIVKELQIQSGNQQEKAAPAAPVDVLTGAELIRTTRIAAYKVMMDRLDLSRAPTRSGVTSMVIPEIPAAVSTEPIPENALQEALEDAN